MNLYNLLSGGDVDYDNFYEKLFADYLTNVTPTILEYVGTVPYTFSANGEPLIDWYIKGNMSQTGTPTPNSPIYPTECGELETTGAHAGQYKIPISSASTTTPVYLGEVETTRAIKKLVLTGATTEIWVKSSSGAFYLPSWYCPTDYLKTLTKICICTHYTGVTNVNASSTLATNAYQASV
jgi:hypothetical protein